MSSYAPSSVRANPRWLVPVAVGLGILLLLVVPAVASYNGMVNKEEAVEESFANMDANLQRRYDLIPQLATAVRAALRQELTVVREITDARERYAGAGSTSEKVAAANQIESALPRLLAVFEDNPELRSNENVLDFQAQLEGTENRVAQSRREYNGVVRDYNTSIRRFPRSLFAGLFGFDRKPLFEATAGSRDVPTIDLDPDAPTPVR